MDHDKAMLVVAALRSGKYKQAKGVLERIDHGKRSNCATGVICRVALANGVTMRVREIEPDKGSARRKLTEFEGRAHRVPPIVTFWLGARYNHAIYIPVQERNSADLFISVEMLNDSGLTFDQIADLIERFWAWM